jgi:chromatin segregation and condensation protein Rec8/ScpA/Scc1 (kleisin family)
LIKSALLLPARARPPALDPDPPDPTDLTERLRVYAAYRAVAIALGARVNAGLRTYPHPPVAYRPSAPRELTPLDATVLTEAYRRALMRPREPSLAELPTETRMTVTEAMDLLRHALDRYVTVQLSEVVGEGAARQRYVAAFLAVLELARLGAANVEQATPFGAITLARRVVVTDLEEGVTAKSTLDRTS